MSASGVDMINDLDKMSLKKCYTIVYSSLAIARELKEEFSSTLIKTCSTSSTVLTTTGRPGIFCLSNGYIKIKKE